MEGNIIQNARNLFRVSKENEGVKDKRIRDIGIPFESEKEDEGENYYEPVRVVFIVAIILNMKVMLIKVKHYWSKNTLIKLNIFINNLKKSDAKKIQLRMAINFMSSKGSQRVIT